MSNTKFQVYFLKIHWRTHSESYKMEDCVPMPTSWLWYCISFAKCYDQEKLGKEQRMSSLLSSFPPSLPFPSFSSLFLSLPSFLPHSLSPSLSWFLERGEGTEKERERNTDPLPLAHPQSGTWLATQACAPTGNGTSDSPVCRTTPNPLSHTSQGYAFFLLTVCESTSISTKIPIKK